MKGVFCFFWVIVVFGKRVRGLRAIMKNLSI